jgi:triphosphoribosyl-dephospho-CoA synthase
MFAATDGVNTHKGSVFSLGLLCAAAGRLHGRGAVIEREALCAEVARICAGLVERELAAPGVARTAGELLYRQHGLTGARGEAQSGFATARRHGVAPYLHARAQGMSDECALHEALLHLMAHNRDTNLVARGGMAGLSFVQDEARRLLEGLLPPPGVRVAQLVAFDQALIGRNLSPGGSADLLAVSWFLAHLDTPSTPPVCGCD